MTFSHIQNLYIIIQKAFKNNNAEFARFLEISPQQLNNYLTGKHGIGKIMRQRLKDKGISPDWIEFSKPPMFLDLEFGKELFNRINEYDKARSFHKTDFEIDNEAIAVKISKIVESTFKVQFHLTNFDLKINKNFFSKDSVSINLIPDDSDNYLMIIAGNSMRNEGIDNDDIIVVNILNSDLNTIKNNSLVCIFFDGIYFIRKWIKKEENSFYLITGNNLNSIEYKEDENLYLFGVIDSIIKKMVY